LRRGASLQCRAHEASRGVVVQAVIQTPGTPGIVPELQELAGQVALGILHRHFWPVFVE